MNDQTNEKLTKLFQKNFFCIGIKLLVMGLLFLSVVLTILYQVLRNYHRSIIALIKDGQIILVNNGQKDGRFQQIQQLWVNNAQDFQVPDISFQMGI
jgi:hypothetical protein